MSFLGLIGCSEAQEVPLVVTGLVMFGGGGEASPGTSDFGGSEGAGIGSQEGHVKLALSRYHDVAPGMK